ncbi:hypothetical protein [Nonomuraea sp. NPDC050310]|uniref:hypothetical protein n=1 Tax=Nonomuraea sp. NPDC050310 TaxID=3154935 RepID=UPI0033CF2226
MPYATPEQLAVLMGRGDVPFTAAEQARAELVLTLASGVIDGETGQPLDLATTTVELDGNGTQLLLLPRWPVTAVTDVSVVDDIDQAPADLVENVDYRWSRHGRLRRLRCRWPCIERAITATVTAGWDPIPDEVRAICLRLAQAGWDNAAGLESERLGDWSVKYAVPGMNPTTSERSALGLYRARP